MASAVEVANKTGIAALDAVIKASSKKFGTDMSGADFGNLVIFPSGSLLLDLALKKGGLPMGRIIEVLGQEASMKTSFCLQFIGRRQQWRKEQGLERRDLILDLEHTITRDFLTGFGIDMDQVIWLRPESAEEVLQVCLDYSKTGAIDMILIDSVDAMQNRKQQRRQMGETDVGGISKEMNRAVRELVKICSHHETTMLFINQIKMNPGVMFGS